MNPSVRPADLHAEVTANARVLAVTAAEVQPEPVRWLSKPRIPLGEPTILAGAPGIGKTQLAIAVCAAATRGQLDGDLAEPVNVAYVSAEDSIEYTLAPRFLAAGGDPTRMHFYIGKQIGGDRDPSLQLPDDVPLIADWIAQTGAKMIVLDPFVAMIPSSLNSHRDQHVRRAIAPLAAMCHGLDVVAVLILHLNKSQEGDVLSRLSGSVGFGAAARSVLLFAPDPDDPDGEDGRDRILAHAKSNLGRKAPSLKYRIRTRIIDSADGPIETSVALQLGETAISAGDLLGQATSSSEASARTEARDFLIAELANGWVPTVELRERAEAASVGWKTCERTKGQLGIRARKQGTAWGWETARSPTPPKPPLGHLGDLGGDGREDAQGTQDSGVGVGGDLPPEWTDGELQSLIDSEDER
jgi:putative DNA primase/helicase